MVFSTARGVLAFALLGIAVLAAAPSRARNYDIVYVRQPRFGDNDQHHLARGRPSGAASIPAPT